MVSLNVLPKSYSHQADISEDCLLQIFISLSLTLLLSQNFFISLTFLSLHVFISLHTHFSLTLSLSYFTISPSLSLPYLSFQLSVLLLVQCCTVSFMEGWKVTVGVHLFIGWVGFYFLVLLNPNVHNIIHCGLYDVGM